MYPAKLPKNYWQTFALVGAGGLERLVQWGGGAADFWRLPVDTGSLHVHELPETRRQVAAYVSGPTATQLMQDSNRNDLRISSRLPALFEEAEARRQAAAPLTAIGPAGVAGVALVVFCLAAALTGDRRETELVLLLARGGSRPEILRRLLGESAVTVLPGALLATALAVSLLPTPRLAPALLAAAATTLFALLAFPYGRSCCCPQGAGGPPRAGAWSRELLVFAATAAAVHEVRSRGIAPAGQDVDPLLIAAPLLLALSGGLLLARIQPPLMGALARSAGRGSGVIGFLGLARAAWGTGGRGRPSVLPLVALLLAVTTAGFGANVLTAVDGSRAQAARQSVGGDARIAAAAGDSLPPALTEAATALSGVRTGLPVWTDSEAFLFGAGGQGSPRITVVVADPVAYAELARAVGRGQFDPGLLAGGAAAANAPVPALFSKDLAAKATEDGYRLRLGGGEELRARPVGEFDGTPALPGAGAATIVLPAGSVLAHVPRAAKPNLWFGLGPVADARLRALVRETVPAAVAERLLIQTSEATAAELGRDPLQASAGRIFWGSVAAAAVFALLALLITLARAAPERAASLARLRTMGLRPRRASRSSSPRRCPRPSPQPAAEACSPRPPSRSSAPPWTSPPSSAPPSPPACASSPSPHHPDPHPRRPRGPRRPRPKPRSPDGARSPPSSERETADDQPHPRRPAPPGLAAAAPRGHAADAAITCDRLVRIFSTDGIEVQALEGLELTVRQGRSRRPRRSLRQRQVHPAQHPRRPRHPPPPARPPSPGTTSSTCRPRSACATAARPSASSGSRPRATSSFLTTAQNIALPMQLGDPAAGPPARTRPASTSSSTPSASATSTPAGPPNSPADNSSASPSPSPWPTIPPSCSPTNPPANSTPRPAPPSSRRSAPSTANSAPPSSSSRTTPSSPARSAAPSPSATAAPAARSCAAPPPTNTARRPPPNAST
ncbi:hypothetical protein GCM10020254_72990 [Streptomyces goshikiensis]